MREVDLEHLCLDIHDLDAAALLSCVDSAQADHTEIVRRLAIWRQRSVAQLDTLGPILKACSRRRMRGRAAWRVLVVPLADLLLGAVVLYRKLPRRANR